MTYQFKIKIQNVFNPMVWRRIQVSSDCTFEQFHTIIQYALGWELAHLYFFSSKGYTSKLFIEPNFDGIDIYDYFREGSKDAAKTFLSEIFVTEKMKYTYLYDSGDDWKHEIILEKILATEIQKPLLLKGEGACPPEDCGGFWGYEELKITLADTKHPEHKEMKNWLGLKPKDKWDAASFDMEAHQQKLNLLY